MITGYDHFTGKNDEQITTLKEHWMKCSYRNFDKVLEIMVAASSDNHCILCKGSSLNFKTSASLAAHYRDKHNRPTVVEYYLKNFIQKTPQEIDSILLAHQNKLSEITFTQGVIQ